MNHLKFSGSLIFYKFCLMYHLSDLDVYVGKVTGLQIGCKLCHRIFKMFCEENVDECLSKDVSQYMKRAGKILSCPRLSIHRLFNKRTVQLGENSCKVITLLMETIGSMEILIP